MLNPSEIKDLSTADLVAEYNMLTGKNIKRFASRKAGEAQVLKAMQEGGGSAEVEKELTKVLPALAPEAQDKHKATAKKISESWSIPAVREARLTKNAVKVDGNLFGSVAEAFRALNLPMGAHIRFRGKLKAQRNMNYSGKNWELL